MQQVFSDRLEMPTLPLPHSLQPSPVSKHRQVSSAPQTASLTPSAPCLSSQMLGPFNDENWPNSRSRPQHRQFFSTREDVLQRVDMNEQPQLFDFGGGADKPQPSLLGNTFAPSLMQNSQPCSVVVPAYSSKTRLRDFSYEPPRSRAPLTYYYPVRSRSSTPRRRDSPTPPYLNAVKNSYGHVAGPQVPTTAPQLGSCPPTMGPIMHSLGPAPPTGHVYQTSMAPVYSKTVSPGAHGQPVQQVSHLISKMPTPCKYRGQTVMSALPTTLAPSGSSYMGSKDSGPNSLCSTVNRTNQAGKSAVAPVPGQSAHSLLGPARQQSTDLAQTIQLTQTELQERMTKQQQQQMQDKEQELQLTKVSLEEKDREVAKLEKELLEKEGELNDIRCRHDEQAGRKDEDIAERDKTILHLQAKVEYLEHENAQKDDWCRKRDEAARKLEGTLRTKESSFDAQLARKDQEVELKIQELRKKENDVKALEAKVRNLEDQVLYDQQQVKELRTANYALEQEKVTRARELQEKSEELTRFLQELDAKSMGDLPSVIKQSGQAYEDSENSRLKEQLAKSEADLLMLQQWQHAQMA